MDDSQELTKFYNQILSETIDRSNNEEDAKFLAEGFMEIYSEILQEAAEIDDVLPASYYRRGIQVDGYSVSEDEVLTLIACIFDNNPEPYSVSKTEVETHLKRLKGFYQKAADLIKSDSIEEATDAFDLARDIYNTRFTTVNLVVYTNGKVKSLALEPDVEDGVEFIPSVWDIERVHNVVVSGQKREKININVPEMNLGEPIYLVASRHEERTLDSDESLFSGGYTSYLGTIPGKLLFRIYEKYNARLLEKNVRAFLQSKTGVNRGIRETITKTPEMFLAYNNGISGTAESLKTEPMGNGLYKVYELDDFQIVNGGQTTASIYSACKNNPSLLEKIDVQVKITVVDRTESLDSVVDKISRYSNTQNRIQLADFSSNSPFHQKVEELSRSVWAPSKTGGEKQTQWFYERARGQYADERNRSSISKFDNRYPKGQKFSKLELARYENLWDLHPDQASKGNQASFRYFTMNLEAKNRKYVPDENYYKNLIAKIILYQTIKKIVKSNKDITAYWINVIDYTFAYISYKTAQRLNLKKIWDNQDLSEDLTKEIEGLVPKIYRKILKDGEGQNIQQYAKKEQAWKRLKESDIEFNCPEDDLLPSWNKTQVASHQNIDAPTESDNAIIQKTAAIPGDLWKSISKWGKETGNLQKFQNGISFSLGRQAELGKEPSIKQSIQAAKIATICVEKGFTKEPAMIELAQMAQSQ